MPAHTLCRRVKSSVAKRKRPVVMGRCVVCPVMRKPLALNRKRSLQKYRCIAQPKTLNHHLVQPLRNRAGLLGSILSRDQTIQGPLHHPHQRPLKSRQTTAFGGIYGHSKTVLHKSRISLEQVLGKSQTSLGQVSDCLRLALNCLGLAPDCQTCLRLVSWLVAPPRVRGCLSIDAERRAGGLERFHSR